MNTAVDQDLINLIRERRVIPFIGAGFSASLGLPDWDHLLRTVSAEIQGIPTYEEIKKCCNGDYLQIAEYLFIKNDKNIGPLRHKLSSLLQPKQHPSTSTAHIELVNLNASQIYTTNYDETIEETFKEVEHPYSFVALPKHIAAANRGKTQIVKYHGDLRFDHSLVLTESSYYSRLEFESPMDLKFRSDLLGKSVLFIGYSFRDINIRIIWFRLMDMMKDVPESDRPTSFIVRFEKNEVLDDLYRAVGIRTIYLDPDGTATTNEQRSKLLSRFMLQLTLTASPGASMPDGTAPMYMSSGLLDLLIEQARTQGPTSRRANQSKPILPLTTVIEHAANRKVLPNQLESVDRAIGEIAKAGRGEASTQVALWASEIAARAAVPASGSCYAILRALVTTDFHETLRQQEVSIPWGRIWSTILSITEAEHLIRRLQNEITYHVEYDQGDDDLIYAAEICSRLANRSLRIEDGGDNLVARAVDLVNQATRLCSAISEFSLPLDGFSDVTQALEELNSEQEDEDESSF